MNSNIARHLDRMAEAQPRATAIKIPRGRTASGEIDYLTLSFAELAAEADAWGARFGAAGLRRGDRALVMVRPGLPLIASAFALFKLGAVPVIIDPGMGLGNFLGCVARSRPRALVGIPIAQVLSRVCKRAFRTVKTRISVSGSLTARLEPAGAEEGRERLQLPSGPESEGGDLAAILFTSGSTGAPKGVCYEHGMFDAQVRLIRETYGIEPGEVDLPLLPIFALFNPALGMTSVIPEIDPRRPAATDPAKLVQAIQQEKITNSFGSPTLWSKIADHCNQRGETLPSLRRVLCAGAPVPADLWKASRTLIPNGRLHSPYGATEALPLCTVSADEIEAQSVHGACVGRPVASIDVKVIALADGPVATLAAARESAVGEVGEIIARGPVVTREYDGLPEATRAAKIADASASGGVWHRMGDCGHLDASGRLWFHGRKAERVETAETTYFTEPCEQVFRAHPNARRCALIGIPAPGAPGSERRIPAIVAETVPRSSAEARDIARGLRILARQHPHTSGIRTFYFRKRLPVDVRHNAKIHRLALAAWAASGKTRGYTLE